MKYLSHILSLIGILLFYFLGKTYKSKGLGDITSLFFYAGMIICFISLIISFLAPASFNILKKIFLGLMIGVLSLGIIVFAIILFDKFSSGKRVKERTAAIEEQKNQYAEIDVIKSFQLKKTIDSTNSNHQKTAIFQVETNDKSLIKKWNIQIFGFLKSEAHESILNLKVIESDVIPLKNSLEINTYLTENPLQLQRLKSSNKYEKPLEYIVLLTNPDEKYNELKFNEGFAYTSLSQKEVELKDSMLAYMQSKNYHLFHHLKLKLNENLYLKDLIE
ncbi:hypothetical protein [Psychroflexus halocasei]|uniref:Uncharacterized protein n=1 Tax=Psychroflexus halocasei TaxID=908615 RepID=A0A1H4B4H5_9FLAO|nr:hypothetical protein [Psychroflexus halocasei]SEA43063.1 hypothetical protein SAMN05421540_105260 [Psychroflexus halocasei]